MQGAAEELGVSLSAVSHQIAELERYLDAALFDRRLRPFRLTAVGAEYASVVVPSFQKVMQATSRLFRRRGPEEVRVTTYPLLAVKWLLPRLPGFQLRHPAIDLVVSSTNRVLSLQDGEADLAIRTGPAPSDGAVAIPLMRDEAVAVYSSELATASTSPAKLVQSLPLLGSDPSGRLWRRWLAHHRLTHPGLSRGMEFDDALAALDAASAGVGIVLTLRSAVENELRSGKLSEWRSPSTPPFAVQHHLVRSRSSTDHAASESFVEWILGVARGSEGR